MQRSKLIILTSPHTSHKREERQVESLWISPRSAQGWTNSHRRHRPTCEANWAINARGTSTKLTHACACTHSHTKNAPWFVMVRLLAHEALDRQQHGRDGMHRAPARPAPGPENAAFVLRLVSKRVRVSRVTAVTAMLKVIEQTFRRGP